MTKRRRKLATPNPLDSQAPLDRPLYFRHVADSCRAAFSKSNDAIMADTVPVKANPITTSQCLALLGQQFLTLTLEEGLDRYAKAAKLKKMVAAAIPSTPNKITGRKRHKRIRKPKKTVFPIVRARKRADEKFVTHSNAVKARTLRSSAFRVGKTTKPLRRSELKRVRDWQSDDWYV